MKKIIRTIAILILVLSLSACVAPPYYGRGVSYGVSPYYGGGVSYGYSYNVAPQSYYWGYNNQPVMFTRPNYGYAIYDPYYIGPAVVQGVGLGLGFGIINSIFRHHHH